MPTFYRNFVNKGNIPNPEHLQEVGPRLPVQVSIADELAALHTENGETTQPAEGFALFDTGASRTCVDEAVLQRLGLTPTGTTQISTPSDSRSANLYVCTIDFPAYNPLRRSNHEVIGVQLAGQRCIALIGRDFLSHMILIYDGPGARVTFAI